MRDGAGVSEEGRPLWPDRYLTDGQLVIGRGAGPRAAGPTDTAWDQFVEQVARLDWLAWCGREWRALDGGQKTILCVLAFLFTGGFALLLPLGGVAVLR
jgi:hypothetical protein